MVRVLIITLLLSGCATDLRSQHAQVVKQLSKTYDLSQVDHRLTIIKLGRNMPAFYDDSSGKIYTCGECDSVIMSEEIAHAYLSRIGVPAEEQHEIMCELGIKRNCPE